jgi:hypothetical protein
MKALSGVAVLSVLVALAAEGCSSSSASSPGFGGSPGPADNATGGSSSGGSSGGGGGGNLAFATDGGPAALPPEMKAESNYQSPVATGKIVWTANPTSGRVAYVDATTFDVQTVQAGDGPAYLAAVPNPDPASKSEAAIVINVRSHNATLLRSDGTGAPPSATTFPSTIDANSWAMSASGKWAIAWTDATRISNAAPTQGFQDLAVLDLAPSSPRPPTILAVGYRPSQVAFSNGETRAFVVTEDGISVIDLLGGKEPTVTQNFPLSAPVAIDMSTPDASKTETSTPEASTPDASTPEASTPDTSAPEASTVDASTEASSADASTPDASSTGALARSAADATVVSTMDALVRQNGVAAITVVSLKDGSPTRVALPEAPSDLTVSPDGTFAVAVLRTMAAIAVLPLPGIASDPTSLTTTMIPGEIVGRAVVAQNPATKQTSVLLFTTVVPVERLTVLTLAPTPSLRTVVLHAPVFAVFPTSDAENAIVLHTVTPTAGSDVKGAFSIVPIAKDLSAKIVSLSAPPVAVALSPASDRALVMVSDSASIYGVDLVMMPSFEVHEYPLPSPPTAVGIAAAAGSGFVAQDYADGRITFIDLAGGAPRTITGFELSARVIQGSDQ